MSTIPLSAVATELAPHIRADHFALKGFNHPLLAQDYIELVRLAKKGMASPSGRAFVADAIEPLRVSPVPASIADAGGE